MCLTKELNDFYTENFKIHVHRYAWAHTHIQTELEKILEDEKMLHVYELEELKWVYTKKAINRFNVIPIKISNIILHRNKGKY